MKHILLLLIATAFLFQNCSQGFQVSDPFAQNQSSDLNFANLQSVAPPDPGSGEHVKYLGFFASAMEGVGNGDYVEEIKDFANISWVMGGDVEAKILRARGYGMKSIVVVYEAFYPVNGVWTLPALGSAEDLAMKDRVKQVAARYRPYANDIVSFYIMDEPYAKGISSAELDRIATLWKAEFPNHATSMILQPNDFGIANFAPASLDWIGFDCYNSDCNNKINYQNMKKGLKAHQRSFLVPVAFVKEKNPDQDDFHVAAKASNEYAICRADPACIGLFPFIWQSYLEGKKPYRGARDIPVVKARYIEIGKLITGRGVPVAPPVETPAPNVPVPPAPATKDIHRFFNAKTGGHLLSLSIEEGTKAGFQNQGVAFKVFAESAPGLRMIYRCYKTASGKHMASLDANCEGQKVEGPYGYIYEAPVAGSVPLYRFYHLKLRDHLITVNFNEGGSNGYNIEGVMGYVKP